MPLCMQTSHAHRVALVLLATSASATFGPENEPPDLWSELDAVGAAVWQLSATTGGYLRRESALLGEGLCMHAFGMNLHDTSEFIGNRAYLVVLLVTFPIALLQGASPVAIFQLGTAFLFTEWATPYLPTAFSHGAAHPNTSLVIITLVTVHGGGQKYRADRHHLGLARAAGRQSGTVGGRRVVVHRAVVTSVGRRQRRLDDGCIHHAMGTHVRMRVAPPHARSRHADVRVKNDQYETRQGVKK